MLDSPEGDTDGAADLDHPPEIDLPDYKATLNKAVDALWVPLGRPETILDVGCNIGMWSRAFARRAADVIGLDAPHMEPHVLRGFRFLAHDLRKPIPTLSCDAAVCLEVAEHLPEDSGQILVDSLADSADVVLFSAATPGQGGYRHVNEQPFDYWEARFVEHGFDAYLGVRSLLRHRCPELPAYYLNNIVIFRRRM